MVRIVDFKERVNKEGMTFNSLIVMSGVEIIESVNGNFYATTRKASIPTTFDEETCKSFIGQELQGTIGKVECDPYEYVHPLTGELLRLDHRYIYIPDEKPAEENARIMDGMELNGASFEFAH